MPNARLIAFLIGGALAAILVVTGAFAQDATPTPAPTETPAPAASPAPPQRFYLELDAADINLLAQAVNELPKRVADPFLLKLQGQLQAGAQAKIVENKDAAEKPKKGKK
jgi:hypothetical protein